jgi:hypothetical protein
LRRSLSFAFGAIVMLTLGRIVACPINNEWHPPMGETVALPQA